MSCTYQIIEQYQDSGSNKTKSHLCNGKTYSNGSVLCKDHYRPEYNNTFKRLEKEIKCPQCQGISKNEPCEICFDRGWVNPHEITGEIPS